MTNIYYNAYISCFGSSRFNQSDNTIRTGAGYRVIKINMTNGETSTFAINKSQFPEENGLGRLTDVAFGPDGAMYITDFSMVSQEDPNAYIANTGVIWRITKK